MKRKQCFSCLSVTTVVKPKNDDDCVNVCEELTFSLTAAHFLQAVDLPNEMSGRRPKWNSCNKPVINESLSSVRLSFMEMSFNVIQNRILCLCCVVVLMRVLTDESLTILL